MPSVLIRPALSYNVEMHCAHCLHRTLQMAEKIKDAEIQQLTGEVSSWREQLQDTVQVGGLPSHRGDYPPARG